MELLIQILSVIVAILLIGVVLIQKSKGGGLSSSFAGSNQIMGVRRTNDFIEKATWTLASIICVLAIASAFITDDAEATDDLKSTQATTVPAAAAQGQYGDEAKPAAPEAAPATEAKTAAPEAAPAADAKPATDAKPAADAKPATEAAPAAPEAPAAK